LRSHFVSSGVTSLTKAIPQIPSKQDSSPIFKKGNQGLRENYRPVTSHITKVFEEIVRKKLQDHLEDNITTTTNMALGQRDHT